MDQQGQRLEMFASVLVWDEGKHVRGLGGEGEESLLGELGLARCVEGAEGEMD